MILTLKRGFTYPELILVMGILITLFGLSTINLLPVQRRTSLSAQVNSLMSDLRSQQGKAMTGATNGLNYGRWGVNFASDEYVLFQGDTYDPNDSSNFVVSLPPEFTLSTNVAGSQVVFEYASGEIVEYVSGSTVTLTDTQSSDEVSIIINKYGAVE